MKTLRIAVVGSSGSFPELIKSFSDEGFRVLVQFYPTSYGTDLFKQSYDVILIDDYTRHKNLFTLSPRQRCRGRGFIIY